MASTILKNPSTRELYRQTFQDKHASKIWEYFLFLTEIPRPSGHLEQVQQALLKLVDTTLPRNVEAMQDSVGNILLRKPATPGLEHLPGICIQGHMDMVTTKSESLVFDFKTDAIQLELDEDAVWLRAKDTTLGADNGMGVAAGLALMSECTAHPLLECLFTVDEETTMAGAELLQSEWLKSQILINCDSEEEHAICMGCAGGQENTLTLHNLPLRCSTQETHKWTCLEFKLTGCRGGHSGCDIEKGFGNAGKILNRVLSSTLRRSKICDDDDDVECYLIEYRAGNAANAIPTLAQAKLFVSDVSQWKSDAQKLFRTICDEFGPTEGTFDATTGKYTSTLSLEITERGDVMPEVKGIGKSDIQRVFDFVTWMPHGVLRMAPELKDFVESSTSMAMFQLVVLPESASFEVHNFTRSSRDSALVQYAEEFESLARVAGASNSGILNYFPGWVPNIHSKALGAAKAAHVDVFDLEPRVYSIHAGLECGFIMAKYPHIDCISIGPVIENAHSITERVLISSVDRFWNFLNTTIKNLSQV